MPERTLLATLREWISRLTATLRPSRSDRDLEEELAQHLEIATEELCRQGYTHGEAARLARVRAGNSTHAMETMREQRGIPPLSTFWLDVKLGLRMLRRHWGLTLIGGVAMTAAITLGASFFNFLQAITGTSLPLEEGDRVVVLQPWDPVNQQRQATSMDDFEYWRDTLQSVVDLSAFRDVQRNLTTDAGPQGPVPVAEMSAGGFRVARVAPLLGRFLDDQDERPDAAPVVVIGYNVWRARFAADADIVGRRLQLDGVFRTVVGVMPPGFAFPVRHAFWTPLGEGGDPVTVFGRLAPGGALARAQAEIEALGVLPSPGSSRQVEARAVPYIAGISGERNPWLLRLVPVLLALLLVPPCTNIGVLIYARTMARQGEFAARTALGASRGRIVGQIFIEVLLLAGIAAAASAALAPAVSQRLSYMFVFAGQPFWMDFGLSYGTILFAAVLAVIAALIAGAIPALRATGSWQLAGLNALHRGTAPRLGWTWTAIVVAQVALSVAVVPAAVEVSWKTLSTALVGPGFAADEFLNTALSMSAGDNPIAAAARFSAARAELARQLEADPDIGAVTMMESEPLFERNATVEVELPVGVSQRESVAVNRVDGNFFDAFGIPLLAGRGFEPGDEGSGGPVLVNRAFVARVMAGADPLGRRVRVLTRSGPQTSYQIVGLVADQFVGSGQPTMYRPLPILDAAPPSGGALVVHVMMHTGPALPSGFATRLERMAAAIDPALRIDDFQTLGEIYLINSLPDYIGTSALAALAGGVLAFSVTGIYTLMSFTVVQRRREIGIRAALGASPRRLVAGIFRRVLVPVAAGAALGGVVAILVDSFFAPILFDSPEGRPLPWILPAAEAFIILIGVAAIAGPVRRALRVDAVEALRES